MAFGRNFLFLPSRVVSLVIGRLDIFQAWKKLQLAAFPVMNMKYVWDLVAQHTPPTWIHCVCWCAWDLVAQHTPPTWIHCVCWCAWDLVAQHTTPTWIHYVCWCAWDLVAQHSTHVNPLCLLMCLRFSSSAHSTHVNPLCLLMCLRFSSSAHYTPRESTMFVDVLVLSHITDLPFIQILSESFRFLFVP